MVESGKNRLAIGGSGGALRPRRYPRTPLVHPEAGWRKRDERETLFRQMWRMPLGSAPGLVAGRLVNADEYLGGRFAQQSVTVWVEELTGKVDRHD